MRILVNNTCYECKEIENSSIILRGDTIDNKRFYITCHSSKEASNALLLLLKEGYFNASGLKFRYADY